MKIRDLLDKKGYDVVTVPPSFPLQDAMRLLVEHNIGSVVVAKEKVVEGILTERDILRLAAKEPGAMAALKVEEVMTKNVVVALPEDSVDYVMEIMTKNRIRHLPVVSAEGLRGFSPSAMSLMPFERTSRQRTATCWTTSEGGCFEEPVGGRQRPDIPSTETRGPPRPGAPSRRLRHS
jgi:CBS domain-containing protein